MNWTAGRGHDVGPLTDTAEIVANFWYLVGDDGFIYSLRIKLYVCEGSEEDKRAFLKSRAYSDYLVARPFPLPHQFSTRFVGNDGSEAKYPVIHHDQAVASGGIDQLFWEGLDQMRQDLPAQTKMTISESPLIKVTALVDDGNGDIVPLDTISNSDE